MKIRALATKGFFLLSLVFGFCPSIFAAGQWVSIGPKLVTAPALPNHVPPLGAYNAVGRLTTIAIHPTNPQIIYVGSPGELGREGCGIWKTTDGGSTWTPIGDSLPTLAVAAIAIDPTDPDRLYIATADQGIFRSDDAGQNWTNLSLPLPVRTNTGDGDRTVLLINPTNPNMLYLTTDDGVLRSADGGQSWPASLDVGNATSLVMDPLNPDVLYAGILGLGVYKTLDGGIQGDASWHLQSQSPLPASVPAVRGPLVAISHPAADANETVYALYPTNTVLNPGWELFRTTDGTSWGSGSLYSCAPGSDGCLFVVLAVDPANKDRVFLGGPLLFTSEIGVTPFAQVPPVENDRQPDSPHGDYWELAFDPTNSKNVYAGSDGGIFRSSNHGLTGSWSFIGDGITNVEMYDLAQAETHPGLLIAGTQDNGNILYTGSPVWDHIPHSQVQGGDGAAVAIDPTNASIFYAMGQLQDSLSQSPDGGGSFVDFHNGLPASPGTICAAYNSTFHLQIHSLVPTTLLASCGSLWRTTTNTPPGNWISIFSPPGTTGSVVRSAIDGGSDLYYAGTNLGHVFAGPSGGGWQDILSHPNSQNVSDIKVDRAHPDMIYVSFAPPFQVDRPCAATAGQDRIYQLKRMSSVPNPTFSLTDITGNLRSSLLCVNTVAIDPHIPQTVYAGTNRGVYRGRGDTTGGPWVWEPYNNGMPLADVRDLQVHPSTGNIDAATYGRSAFELVPNLPPVALCKDVMRFADDKCQAAVEPEMVDNGSFDPEGFPLIFSLNPPGPYSKGQTVVTLTVTDDDDTTDTCKATITVNDIEKPNITCLSPTVECSSPAGAVVTKLIDTVSDNCGVATSQCTPAEGSTFPLGVDPFTCSATDTSGNSNSCTSKVTVTDTTPPVISSIVANPSTLWPPNHKLVPVSITVTATDICDTSPKCKIVSVTSNEPVLGPGSGHTDPDWIISDPGPKVSPATLGVMLRPERTGGGSGRVYTINVSCSDTSGNTTSGQTTLKVPHNQSK